MAVSPNPASGANAAPRPTPISPRGGRSGADVATTPAMASPYGVVADSSGNFYVAAFGTNRSRVVDPTGKISTKTGDGNLGFAGAGGPANKVEMNGPTAVAIDGSGN